MNAKRAAILVIALGALAAWITAAATSGVRDVRPVARFTPPPIDASGAALEAEIARLHDRLRPTASPRLGRDLFQFTGRPRVVPQAVPAAPPPISVPAPTPAPPPTLTLIGVAQEGSEGSIVLTAIISTPGQLFLVKEGDEVTSAGARYRVTKVSAAATDLAAADETILHLALK